MEVVDYVAEVAAVAPFYDHIVCWAFDGEDLADCGFGYVFGLEEGESDVCLV